MKRAVTLALVLAALAAGKPAAAGLDPALATQGWRMLATPGVPTLSVEQDGETTIRLRGAAGLAIAYQAMRVPVGPNTCLAWRWRVDSGPPATDLSRTASDRALALWIGFEADGERMTMLQRYLLGMARLMSGRRLVPGFFLVYVHGGTGEEEIWHRAPQTGLLGRTLVLERAGTAEGGWIEHRVPLWGHFRAAFGIAPTGFVTEVVVSADGDDTGAAIDSRISELRFVPCRNPTAQPGR
ncbi:DUF3047 domain-containing protein [Elioraea rosea]|uniref:DUF3047 domain-containing protein n=1 Tax=Elioraea rosea TaxID=2492390 RepID=UPI00118263E5|nr:DUF3047 domain-containing protein [Elioraea rosea]